MRDDCERQWSATGFQKTSFGRFVARSSLGSAQERPGAINLSYDGFGNPGGRGRGLAPLSGVEGEPDCCPSEATGHRNLRCFGVFANLMIFGAPLSVSDTLQCVSQTRPQWGPVGILVVGVSSRGVWFKTFHALGWAARAADY